MFKFISAQDVEANYDINLIIEKIERAYRDFYEHNGSFPDRYFMPTDSGGDLLVGSSYPKSLEFYGVIASSYTPTNEGTEHALINGVVVLFSGATGEISAILDEPTITKLRTGAKTALAVKYLAREDSKILGIIGMGTQAFSHVEAISKVREIEEVVVWSRNPEEHKDLISFAKEKLNLPIIVMNNPNDVAGKSDILVHATWSKIPLVSTESIRPGTFVVGLFHDSGAVEYDESLLAKSKVFIDTKSALSAGTIKNALSKNAISEGNIIELGNVISKEYEPMNGNDFYYFQSVGHGIENVAGAVAVLASLSK